MTDDLPKKEPITGWLVLIGIGIWATPFLTPLNLLSALTATRNDNFVFVGTLIGGLLVEALAIALLLLFIKRKSKFVVWYLVSQGISALTETGSLINGINSHTQIIVPIVSYIEIVVIVLYFLRSKRVKRTFVL